MRKPVQASRSSGGLILLPTATGDVGTSSNEPTIVFPNEAAALPASDPAAPLAPDAGPRRNWWRLSAIIAACLALVAGATIVSLNDFGTHHTLHTTRMSLINTQTNLSNARATLASTESELTSAQVQLTSMTDQRNQLRNKLAGVRNSLNAAKNTLNLQAGQIAVLKTCLAGVNNALGYVLYNDYASAAAALDSVRVSCDNAFALF